MTQKFATVDDYISSFPEDVQFILQKVRQTMWGAAPAAEETISYQIPTLAFDGRYLIHFAAWKDHLAVYPAPAGDEAFEKEIAPYRAARSTARFPYRNPIPYDLIGRLAALRVEIKKGSRRGE